MGKTSKPVKFLVHHTLAGHPELLALQEKGHHVTVLPVEYDAYTVILGPHCWRMDTGLLDEGLLSVCLTACRKPSPERASPSQQELFSVEDSSGT